MPSGVFWNVEIIVLTILYALFLSFVSTYLKCMCVLLGFILGFISTVYIVYCVSVWALLPDLNKLVGLDWK